MKIIIASQNPVKINSVKSGFKNMIPDGEFIFEGVSVPSEVSDQPMSVQETYTGSLNRIKNAKIKVPNADFYCGIEGGLEFFDNNCYAFAWIIIDDGKITGKARTGSFLLPPKIVELINKGMELGHADDIVFGHSNSKQKQGSVGILTHDKIDRTGYYMHAVTLALIPFVNEKMF